MTSQGRPWSRPVPHRRRGLRSPVRIGSLSLIPLFHPRRACPACGLYAGDFRKRNVWLKHLAALLQVEIQGDHIAIDHGVDRRPVLLQARRLLRELATRLQGSAQFLNLRLEECQPAFNVGHGPSSPPVRPNRRRSTAPARRLSLRPLLRDPRGDRARSGPGRRPVIESETSRARQGDPPENRDRLLAAAGGPGLTSEGNPLRTRGGIKKMQGPRIYPDEGEHIRPDKGGAPPGPLPRPAPVSLPDFRQFAVMHPRADPLPLVPRVGMTEILSIMRPAVRGAGVLSVTAQIPPFTSLSL